MCLNFFSSRNKSIVSFLHQNRYRMTRSVKLSKLPDHRTCDFLRKWFAGVGLGRNSLVVVKFQGTWSTVRFQSMRKEYSDDTNWLPRHFHCSNPWNNNISRDGSSSEIPSPDTKTNQRVISNLPHTPSTLLDLTSQADRCNLFSAQFRTTNVMASIFFLWSIQDAFVNLVGDGVDGICWRALGSTRKKQ